MAITKREADDLRRVVKARFEVLHDQVHQRRTEIANRVEETIEADYKPEIDAVEAKLEVVRKKMRKLNAEAKALIADVEANHPNVSLVRARYSNPDNVYVMEIGDAKAVIPNLSAEVAKRTNMITEAAGLATLNLRHTEVGFLEKLTLGTIETADAQAFFDSLPVVDQYLPLPSVKEIKALTP